MTARQLPMYGALVPPTLCETFIQLARETWRLLLVGASVNLIPGEETLTDLNLLRLRADQPIQVRVKRFSHHDEALFGADWEMWLASRRRYLGLRIQAKKLNPTQLVYEEFATSAKRQKAESQSEKLLEASRLVTPTYPLYVFYNAWLHAGTSLEPWNCGTYQPDLQMLGCAVSPATHIKPLLVGPVALADVLSRSLPWSCLVCCQGYGEGSLPDRAKALIDGTLLSDDFDYRAEVTESPPEYVLAAETDTQIDEPSDLPSPNLSHVVVVREDAA